MSKAGPALAWAFALVLACPPIQVQAQTQANTHTQTKAQAPGSAAPKPVTTGCTKSAFRVALDVGHYLAAPGATSARGVTEFTYNRALAAMVLRAIKAAGFTGSFLIGDAGDMSSLPRRPAIAREQGASLFVSLHHDSVQKQYLATWTVDGRERAYSDRFHGYSIFVSASSPWARDSMALAQDLGRDLRAQGLAPSLHHAEPIPGEGRTLLDPTLGIYRFDELAVLRGATMPALLLESGIIVNREEEQAIQSGRYHPKIAAALAQAIDQYCASHG